MTPPVKNGAAALSRCCFKFKCEATSINSRLAQAIALAHQILDMRIYLEHANKVLA